MGGRIKYASEEERQEAARASKRKYNKSSKGRSAMKSWYAKNKGDTEFQEMRNTRQQEYRASRTEEELVAQREKDAQATREDRRRNPLKHLLYDAKKRAKQKGLEFSLVAGDLTIPDVCPVLGIPLAVAMGGKRSASSPSLDRWDNTLGYTLQNTRVISLRANTLKNDATVPEMELVLAYMKGEK